MIAVGVIIQWLGLRFVSGLFSGLLGKNLALDEIQFMGNSLFSWGMQLLVFIPCALYVLLYLWTLAFPVDKIGHISVNSDVLAGLIVVGTFVFWGALLSGLFRMYREVKILDHVDSTDDKN